ncbi:type II toxin-antitoxin system ParD family antitoxin [Brenneria roseae subsp. americana]|uniref:Antitoxin ParD n=1 Tax=Brenneria roseae subsp. americana TaxID=1508507 RepID=A0A2U1U2D1_9GAMM|nr:type II toxin-antitoxin system ParD family antitoxin [Brenneria roseae]PWC15793.1 type II toxin-antitoxin system ParD family antitoxin [Brenneria roseae subsp. americana]
MARTMTIDLGDELRHYVESLVESGDYRTQSEVIREALRLLREKQAESDLQKLRNLVADGLTSGEPQEWNRDEFLQKVRDKVRAQQQRN